MNTKSCLDTDVQKKRRGDFIKLAQLGKFMGVTRHIMPELVYEKNIENNKIFEFIVSMGNQVGREGFINQQKLALSKKIMDKMRKLWNNSIRRVA